MVAANSLVKSATQDAEFRLFFKHDAGVDYGNCRILCSSDAAFRNAATDGDKLKSQAGYMLGVRAKDGDALPFLEFSMGTVKPVCRSTLAAEASGLVVAVEATDCLRSAILAVINPNMSLGDLVGRGDVSPAQIYADARSRFDVVTKDASRPQDKRLSCDCSATRDARP